MKTIIAAILLIMCVSGCSSTKPVVLTPSGTHTEVSPASGKKLDPVKDSVDIDFKLLEECSSFVAIKNSPSPKEVLTHHSKDVATLRECSDKHRSLVKIIREAFNIKTP